MDAGKYILGPTAAEGMAKLFAKAEPAAKAIAMPKPPRARLIIDLPGVVVKSEANIGGKLRGKIARKEALKAAVKAALPGWPLLWLFGTPVRVTLTRIGAKRLDSDNLAHCFKVCRDVIADWIGCDDGDESRVTWRYDQKPGWVAGIRIEVV